KLLVEQARLLDDLAPQEKRRAERVPNVERLTRGVPCPRVAPVEPALDEPPRHGEQVDDELRQTGELKGAVLERAIAVNQPRTCQPRAGSLRPRDQRLQRTGRDDGIRV